MDLFKDIIKSINTKSGHVFDEHPDQISSYVGYVVNKAMSMRKANILFANEMNKCSHLPLKMQYDFYYHGTDKASGFSPWPKIEKLEYLDLIKEYYKFSDTKAKEALSILTDDQLLQIKNNMYEGEQTK